VVAIAAVPTVHSARPAGANVEDTRAGSLLAVSNNSRNAVRRLWPWRMCPAFCGSRAHGRLREVLAAQRYSVREARLCPTALGVPKSPGAILPGRQPLRTAAVGTLAGGD